MSEELIPIFLKNVLTALTETANSLETFPEIPAMIRTLAGSHSLAIITSNSSLAAREFAIYHKLSEHFVDFSGADQPGSKSAKIIAYMEKLNFSPDSTYYVGDAGTDVEQGREAGVKTVAVTWGFQGRERLLEAQPDFLVDSPSELLEILF